MKRPFAMLFLIPGLLVSSARAQVPLRFDLGAGIAFPSAPGIARRYWDTGYTFSAGARWRYDARWNFGADVALARFDPKDPSPVPLGSGNPPGQSVLHVIPVTLTGEFALSEWSNTRPFLAVQLGYVRVRTPDASDAVNAPAGTTPRVDSDCLGIGFGAGVRTLLTGNADLVLDAGWRAAFAGSRRISWVPIRIAIRF
jgi:hypothetical protein